MRTTPKLKVNGKWIEINNVTLGDHFSFESNGKWYRVHESKATVRKQDCKWNYWCPVWPSGSWMRVWAPTLTKRAQHDGLAVEGE